MNNLPIPPALYPCKICSSDYSWPAEDLFWSDKAKNWICRDCWQDEHHGEKGTSLAAEIDRRALAFVRCLPEPLTSAEG